MGLKYGQENYSLGGSKTSDTNDNFFLEFRTFLKTGLNFEDDNLDIILSNDFKEATKEFVKRARYFDPSISLNDIYQACRNVWIMNGVQQMLGLPVRLTPAVFAYSMLYPYSDNYLDNPDIPAENKITVKVNRKMLP